MSMLSIASNLQRWCVRLVVTLSGIALLASCGAKEKGFDSSQLNFSNTNLLLNPASNPPTAVSFHVPTEENALLSPADLNSSTLREAGRIMSQGNLETALANLNIVLNVDPKNLTALSMRGSIYTKMKDWEKATRDFKTMLQVGGADAIAHFNLSELDFDQQKYNNARSGFEALEKDPDFGDLAAYKVFLCDLFGGQEEVAQRELDAFNKTGSKPSYYFANLAWYLFLNRPEDARTWLESSETIYAPYKVTLYTTSLKDLGYLPIHPSGN